jgi:tetratricopeptide (TPR) repeat protein
LLFDLHDEIAKVPGSIKTQEMLVETSLDYLDTLYRSAASDPGLQEELATAYKKVGDIQGNERGSNTGHHQDALKSFARSIALFEPLIASDPSNHRAGFTLANAYVEQGSILLVLGRVDDALTSVNKGVALGESLAPFFAKDADRAGQLGTAYWTQADILVRLGRSPEAMASIDKLLALVEEFWRSDPKSKAALSILSGAYNNASAHPDMRLPADARNQRTLFMLRRSVWASEQLVALAPDDEEERFSLALSQSNLGRQLAWQGDHSAALPLFRAASTVVGARARNPDDARARYLSAMVDSALAEALFKLGHVEEARVTLLRCNKELKALIASSSTLRIEYAFGHNAVRLGELYALLAGDSRRSRNDRLTYWQQARDAYESGVSPLQKVAAAVALEEADMAPVNVGVAGLARARSEIATLTK